MPLCLDLAQLSLVSTAALEMRKQPASVWNRPESRAS